MNKKAVDVYSDIIWAVLGQYLYENDIDDRPFATSVIDNHLEVYFYINNEAVLVYNKRIDVLLNMSVLELDSDIWNIWLDIQDLLENY